MSATEPEPAPLPAPIRHSAVENAIEHVIFASRWLMAPIYLGLIVALGVLVATFFRELALELPHLFATDADGHFVMEEKDVILLVLTLLDISLAGNLVLIILFSGYENFVSKIEAARADRDRPEWMGTLDFSGLKIKLIASIVAISGIHLLKVFMNLGEGGLGPDQVRWYVIIHLAFVASGVVFALMDWIEAKSHAVK